MLHYIKMKGFALISVLLFIQIFVILTLYAVRNSMWEIQIAEHFSERQNLSNAVEVILNSVETAASLHRAVQACPVKLAPALKLSNQTPEWWQSQACAGNLDIFHYYYLVEHIGMDNCADVVGVAADYYQVSVMLTGYEKAKVLVQSTVVLPEKADGTCLANRHTVSPSRQFWHEIL